ncbi:MAG TPA: hypothetical protein VLJ14_13085 [Ktedonobacterales bacterium]|jgi:hypothetical protein|nr:hypothetical protein [Ktedonobacterales bacterium]
MTHPHPTSGHESHPSQPPTPPALPLMPAMSTPLQPGQPGQPVSAEAMAQAMRQVERQRSRGKLGRRALLGAAGVGVCAGAVAFGPGLVQQAGLFTEQQLQQEVQRHVAAAVAAERQHVLNELKQIEDVSIEAAIGVAGLTRAGVNAIVLPMTKFTSTITADALAALANAVQGAHDTLSHFNITLAQLDDFHALLLLWSTNVRQLPTALDLYANTDITQAERYLTNLKKLIDDVPNAAATPAGTTTPAQ